MLSLWNVSQWSLITAVLLLIKNSPLKQKTQEDTTWGKKTSIAIVQQYLWHYLLKHSESSVSWVSNTLIWVSSNSLWGIEVITWRWRPRNQFLLRMNLNFHWKHFLQGRRQTKINFKGSVQMKLNFLNLHFVKVEDWKKKHRVLFRWWWWIGAFVFIFPYLFVCLFT